MSYAVKIGGGTHIIKSGGVQFKKLAVCNGIIHKKGRGVFFSFVNIHVLANGVFATAVGEQSIV